MKLNYFLVFIFVFFCSVVYSKDLNISVLLEKSRYKQNENIMVYVLVYNNGTKSLLIPENMVLNYHFITLKIIKDNKDMIKYTGPKRKIGFSDETISISPGKSYGIVINLADYYSIISAGTYSIKAFYEVKYGVLDNLTEYKNAFSLNIARGCWEGKIESRNLEFEIIK